MRSLRARILIPLLSLTGLVLGIFGVVLDRTLSDRLLQGMDDKLLTMARSVASAVETDVLGNVEFDPGDIGIPELLVGKDPTFFSVHDAEGVLVAATRNAPQEIDDLAPGPDRYERESIRGHFFRVCRIWVEREPEPEYDTEEDGVDVSGSRRSESGSFPRFLITVGSWTDELDAAVASFRTKMLLGGAVLFAILMIVPLLVVSHTLAGVRRLSREAEAIGPESPEARLAEKEVAEEIRPFVSALNAAVDRLAQAHDREKRFSADVAHELRTPLSAIRTRCEVSLRRTRTNEEFRESIEQILRSCTRLTALVEKMLMLARYQRQSNRFSMRRLDLSRIAREVARLHEAEAAAKDLSLEVAAEGEVFVRGDEELLRECLSNLVHNAVRYTPPSGTVRVDTWNGSSSGIQVQDTGIGIEPGQQQKIFDRFYRVQGGRESGGGSFGLGLFLAREIAELHGTRIDVESEPGEGSRFSIVFETSDKGAEK